MFRLKIIACWLWLVLLLFGSASSHAQSFREQLNQDLLTRGDSGYVHACLVLSQRNIARGLPWRAALDSTKKAAEGMPPYYRGQCLMAVADAIPFGHQTLPLVVGRHAFGCFFSRI